jgi:hypothetical protein
VSWDLRSALLKKQEVESARLMDFEFRLRARAMRRLGAALGIDGGALAGQIALQHDAGILADLATRLSIDACNLHARWEEATRLARAELIAETGDPTPHRLA